MVHRYEPPGTYDVRIQGTLDGWSFDDSIDEDSPQFSADGDPQKLLAIQQWGSIGLADGGGQFFGASNLTIGAEDAPDLKGITNLEFAFAGCISLQTAPGMSEWDVSNVITLEGIFTDASSFNQPLEGWDVSNVIEMESMFSGASSFNQPLQGWDVSNVTRMGGMFSGVPAFEHCADEPHRCFEE